MQSPRNLALYSTEGHLKGSKAEGGGKGRCDRSIDRSIAGGLFLFGGQGATGRKEGRGAIGVPS